MKLLLPHDLIEDILETLDPKTLLKFKSVSKQWKSTIQSPFFHKRQMLFHRKQSGDNLNILLVSLHDASVCNPYVEAMRTLVLGSSSSVSIPTSWENKDYYVCMNSCDGLICLYDRYDHNLTIVVNPTIRWQRVLPLCNYQETVSESNLPFSSPGFGKDKINGTYKLVWLYNNSIELGLKNNAATTCEVFDFTTNAWKYIVPSSDYTILHLQDPVYLDGSLHWLTDGETKILSLDLHTETFQVMSKFPLLRGSHPMNIMCNLDDRLCLSERIGPNKQVIWSFDSDNKTWKIMYSIDLDRTSSFLGTPTFGLTPLAVLEKDKLLFYECQWGPLVTYSPKTNSYDLAYESKLSSYALCYFPSLISIL